MTPWPNFGNRPVVWISIANYDFTNQWFSRIVRQLQEESF